MEGPSSPGPNLVPSWFEVTGSGDAYRYDQGYKATNDLTML